MSHVQGHVGCSERRGRAPDEPVLVCRIEEIVQSHPRHSYRMVCRRLPLDGWLVNHKRVHRLCRRDGLRVPRKNAGNGASSCRRTGSSASARCMGATCGAGTSWRTATSSGGHCTS
ncbi:MAG: transposase [Betaproteobacteria bacterium]|nr:transposase [Betaproteobacteria bacterium]